MMIKMGQKELKINIPEGYEIDKKNSSFELIKFKKIEKKLPETWEEFCITHPVIQGEIFIEVDSSICKMPNMIITDSTRNCIKDRNLLPNKKYAEAMLALCQLIQLRDCYNDGWVPDWNKSTQKYCIEIVENTIAKFIYTNTSKILTFKTLELRDKFLENFRDLIEIAKPLL